MKVLHITSSFMPPKIDGDLEGSKTSNDDEGIYSGARVGGFASVIDGMAQNLTQYEHHVLLSQGMTIPHMEQSQYGEWKGRKNVEVRDGLHIHYFPNSGDISSLTDVHYTFQGLLEQAYEDFQFDVIITHVVIPNMDLSQVSKKCRWVNFTHGSKNNADLPQDYMDLIDTNLLFSDYQRQFLKDNSKTVVLPFPVCTDRFYPRFPTTDSHFVWCGRIAPEKKIIDFAVRFEDEMPDYSKLFVIGGPDNPNWKFDIEHSDLEKIHFLGRKFDDRLAEELSKHGFFVLMSDYETYCVALLEAASAGCTVYAIRRDGLEWAEDLVHFVPDMDSLIEAIQPENLVIKDSHELVESQFSWNALKSQYESVIGQPSNTC